MTQTMMILVASITMGVAAAWLVRSIGLCITADGASKTEGYFEVQRRAQLRAENATYRWFEPLVDELSNGMIKGSGIEASIARQIEPVRLQIPWHPRELGAVWLIDGVAMAGVLFVGVALMTESVVVAAVAGMAVAGGSLFLRGNMMKEVADKRLAALKRKLPYAVDLMALMMEAGGGFLECLATVVADNKGHPLGEEFGDLLRDVDLGRTRTEALERLKDRWEDADLRELIFAIVKGEELGTPLSQILRSQADQMRLKRSQWAEKAAADAQVKIVFPGTVIMVACLLIVVAPFLLKLVDLF